jgi:hypothetical protein
VGIRDMDDDGFVRLMRLAGLPITRRNYLDRVVACRVVAVLPGTESAGLRSTAAAADAGTYERALQNAKRGSATVPRWPL